MLTRFRLKYMNRLYVKRIQHSKYKNSNNFGIHAHVQDLLWLDEGRIQKA